MAERGRFAPTPSGRMHLGNVFSELLAWLSIRASRLLAFICGVGTESLSRVFKSPCPMMPPRTGMLGRRNIFEIYARWTLVLPPRLLLEVICI